jgi:hypothetical protein
MAPSIAEHIPIRFLPVRSFEVYRVPQWSEGNMAAVGTGDKAAVGIRNERSMGAVNE